MLSGNFFPPPVGQGQRPYGRRLVGVRPFLHLLMPSLFIARITDIALRFVFPKFFPSPGGVGVTSVGWL